MGPPSRQRRRDQTRPVGHSFGRSNHLYGELEGKSTGAITGPITFGEIAYQLLNQTMAYMSVADAA